MFTPPANQVERCIVLAATDWPGAVAALVAQHLPNGVITRVLYEPERRFPAPLIG